MNGARIESILRKDAKCRRMFLGVFPSDRLPNRFDSPALMVCNTDPHDKPGEHWIAIYVEDDGYGEYFDSFGLPPKAIFRTFLNRNCRNWIFNNKHVQSAISRFCGHYCILYCLHRCRGENLNAIVGKFTMDTGLNDYLVHHYICNVIA